MSRYIKLISALFRFWLIRTLEFRIELVTWSINSVLWAFLGLFSVHLIFGQVQSIAGWTRSEVLLLMATQAMFNSILWLFVIPSLLNISETIRDGKFDFLLIKPASNRFMVTFRKFEFEHYPRLIIMSVALIYFVNTFHLTVNVWSILGYLVSLLTGLFIFYCLFFTLTALNFWFIKLHNLEELFDTLVVMGRYPTSIFNSSLHVIFYYVLPIAFVATFPIGILLGKGGIDQVVLGLVVATVFFVFSQWFWNFALRHYSSASS